MLLTIDVGNTNIEFGLYDLTKKDLLGTFRLMTKGSQTSDEIGLTLCDYLNRFGWQPEQIEDVIIASVVPGIMYSLKNAMVKYLGRRPLVINEDVFAELGYLGGATTSTVRTGAWPAWPPWKNTARPFWCWTSAPPPRWTQWTPAMSMWAAASVPASGSAWMRWPRTPPCSPMWN